MSEEPTPSGEGAERRGGRDRRSGEERRQTTRAAWKVPVLRRLIDRRDLPERRSGDDRRQG